MEVMLTIVLLGGGPLLFAAILLTMGRMSRQRRDVIVAAMREVGATGVRTARFGLNAVVRDVRVRWDFLGGGGRDTVHTVCSVTLAPPSRFLLDLRRQTGDELEQVRAGRAVDVIVGDEAFDDAFIVEAAPSEVARKLLDAETRRMLLSMQPLRLCITKDTLWLDVLGVIGHVAIAKSMLELVLAMTRRIAELPLAMAEERMVADARDAGGAAYRGTTPQSAGAVEAWSPQAEEEMQALVLARKRRQHRTWTTMGVGIAVWLAFALATMRCARP